MAGVSDKKMKSVGRNLARAQNQERSKKVPMKYAEGGAVAAPTEFCKPQIGSSTARGAGAATKGTKFGGVY